MARGVVGSALIVTAAFLVAGHAQAVSMEDVATAQGVDFARIGDPENPNPNFLEIMGGGACWIDVDGDGWQDLYLVDGWLRDGADAEAAGAGNRLYRNVEGAFEDVSEGSGIDVAGWYMGCAAADANGDGWVDLFLSGYGIQELFLNQGDGTFALSPPAQSGIDAQDKCGEFPCWGIQGAFADYDRDGCIDLYAMNFAEYDLEDTTEDPTIVGREAQGNQLYRGNCDGTFTDVTAAAGASGDPGPDKGRDWAGTWLDYDRDGWLDIYTASDGVPNTLLRNNGDGTFTEKAAEAGVDDGLNGMGLAVGDCNRDHYEDLFFTHYQSAPILEGQWTGYDGHYVNLKDGTFEKRNGEGDLANAWPYVGWGTIFADFDLDGFVDIHEVTGHTDNFAADRDQKMLLWTGDGTCHWTDVSDASGPAFASYQNSRGSSYADFDWDGDMDAVVVNLHNQPTQLLETTDTVAGANWLQVELLQDGNNPQALQGEVVAVLDDGTELWRRVNPYQSLHGSNAFSVHFGLGDATVDRLEVTWPDLTTTVYEEVPSNHLVRANRVLGTLQTDTLAPLAELVLDGGQEGLGGWFTTAPTASLATTDRALHGAPSGVAGRGFWIDGAPATDGTLLGEGVTSLEGTATDLAGNQAAPRQWTVRVDSSAPSSSLALVGTLTDGWYHGDVHLDFACSDDGSGVDHVQWRILGVTDWAVADEATQWNSIGIETVQWKCMDVAGNMEGLREQVVAFAGQYPASSLDATGPEGLAGWFIGAVSASVVTEAGPYAVAERFVSVNGGPWQSTQQVTLTEEGVHDVAFYAVDGAGREEPVQHATVRMDLNAPRPLLQDDGRHIWVDGTLHVGPAHGLRSSGSDDVSAVVDHGLLLGGQAGSQPLRLDAAGSYELTVWAVDEAGHLGEATVNVLLDLSPPQVKLVNPGHHTINLGSVSVPVAPWRFPSDAILVGPVPILATAVDEASGIGAVTFLVNGHPVHEDVQAPFEWLWSEDTTPEAPNRMLRVEAVDSVGNLAVVKMRVTSLAAEEAVAGAVSGSAPWDLLALPLLPLLARAAKRS
ncbi:MAG: FG-GAP-like repeat-containing protein [Thermoplasmatota archaeon]